MSWSQWRFYFRSIFNSDRFRITTVLSQILPIVGHFLWLEAGFCQFWAISALILNSFAHECQIKMKEARPCVEVGVSSHGFLLQETQETGDRPRNTGHRRELASGNYCWPRSPHSSCRLRQSEASRGSRDPAPPIGGRGAGAGAGAGQVRGCKNRHCLGGQESGHPVHSRLAFSQQRDNSHRQGE